MTFWIILIALCCVALAFVIWPLYRSSGRLTPMLAAIILLFAAGSAGLYTEIGQPGVPSGPGAAPDTTEVVDALAKRLEENPDDVEGWVLLGRSYQSMGQYEEAIAALEKALALEKGENGQTMVSLAIAIMESRGGELTERSSSLFENALALEPNNPNALFYGGSAAATRGDTALAADRWESLMQQDGVPPEIANQLHRQINQWRGLPLPEAAPDPHAMLNPEAMASEPSADAIVSLHVSLSSAAALAMPDNARVFVIARDPAQPTPPIAVVPLQLSGLPARVDLDDRNTMVAGRPLSGFSEFEVIARVSLSGGPAAQSGDWSGSTIVTANSEQVVELVIDQQIP